MQERQRFPIPLRIRALRHKSQHLTRLHYLHLPTRRQFQQKGWVHKSKIIYIYKSSNWIETSTSINIHQQQHQQYHLVHLWFTTTTTLVVTSHQQQLSPTPTMQRPQLRMQYACGTILRALNDKHSRAWALNSWMVKASQGISPQQVNDKHSRA